MTARSDFFTALALVAFGSIVFFEAWRMPRFEAIGGSLATAPGLVPGILSIIVVAFGLLMLLRSVRAGAFAHLQPASDPSEREGMRRLLLMLALSVGYAGFLVGTIPFWLATLAYVFVTVTVFEWRAGLSGRARSRLVTVALVEAALVALAVTLVFERIFLVNLP